MYRVVSLILARYSSDPFQTSHGMSNIKSDDTILSNRKFMNELTASQDPQY
jgi:hypothetical protein